MAEPRQGSPFFLHTQVGQQDKAEMKAYRKANFQAKFQLSVTTHLGCAALPIFNFLCAKIKKF